MANWLTYYYKPLTMLQPTFVLLQATFEGWMELMDDAVDSKEVIVDLK